MRPRNPCHNEHGRGGESEFEHYGRIRPRPKIRAQINKTVAIHTYPSAEARGMAGSVPQ